MGNDLFDMVHRAQCGDNEAMYEIIASFLPAIRYARQKIKPDQQDDLEQNIIETLIKKIMSYDLSKSPDFSAFCRQLNKVHEEDGH